VTSLTEDALIITRWQAPIVPTIEQIKMMFVAEGLAPYEESFEPKSKVAEHRHPFDEVRMVSGGNMLIDVSGNKLLLRPGDRIFIPSNTKHSYQMDGDVPCVCVCANKPF
jgi:mannose-6-phosphate isomerase-like protein (cupin superfamily)